MAYAGIRPYSHKVWCLSPHPYHGLGHQTTLSQKEWNSQYPDINQDKSHQIPKRKALRLYYQKLPEQSLHLSYIPWEYWKQSPAPQSPHSRNTSISTCAPPRPSRQAQANQSPLPVYVYSVVRHSYRYLFFLYLPLVSYLKVLAKVATIAAIVAVVELTTRLD